MELCKGDILEFSIPKHIAITMDGNGRSGRKIKICLEQMAYKEGAKRVKEYYEAENSLCGSLNALCFSIWYRMACY